MIAALLLQAVKMGISPDAAVWETSMKLLMLLLRQKAFSEAEKPGMQLTVIEEIDKGVI